MVREADCGPSRGDGHQAQCCPVQDVAAYLAQPLVARVATSGPTVRPVWFLWEDEHFWWLTGAWSALAQRLAEDPTVALVIDTCDLATGTVLQVSVKGVAVVVPLERGRAVRKLARYLGDDPGKWPARFLEPLDDVETRLVRLRPHRPPRLRDLSYP